MKKGPFRESDWVDVGGVKVDRTTLEEFVREARTHTWHQEDYPSEKKDHSHCVVCGDPIPVKPGSLSAKNSPREDRYYKSNAGWLCSYCFDSFISQPKG